MKNIFFVCTKLLKNRSILFRKRHAEFYGEEFKVRPFLKCKEGLLSLKKHFLQKAVKPV